MTVYRKPLGAAHDEPRTSRPAKLAQVGPRDSERPPLPHEAPERNKRDAVQEVMRKTAYRDPRGAVTAVNAAYAVLTADAPEPVPSVDALIAKAMGNWSPGRPWETRGPRPQ